MKDVRKEGRGTCRAAGKDMNFISDTVRANRASTSHIGDVLMRGTEVSVSREGFTLRAKAQEIRGQLEGGKGRQSSARGSRRQSVGCECRSARGWVAELEEGRGAG